MPKAIVIGKGEEGRVAPPDRPIGFQVDSMENLEVLFSSHVKWPVQFFTRPTSDAPVQIETLVWQKRFRILDEKWTVTEENRTWAETNCLILAISEDGEFASSSFSMCLFPWMQRHHGRAMLGMAF